MLIIYNYLNIFKILIILLKLIYIIKTFLFLKHIVTNNIKINTVVTE